MLGFVAWQTPERPLAAALAPHAAITYILAPVKRLQPAVPASPKPAGRPSATPPAARTRTPAPSEPAAVSAAQPQAITQPVSPPPDPFAEQAAKSPDDLRQRALNSAALVDKQLRKEAWNPRDKRIANDTTALAARIGGAYVGNDSGTTTQEVVMPDGRLMTKVRTPGGGSYCAYKENNALTGGRDPFRDGIKTKVTSCP
ncbi:hypothetical protein SAMN05428959_11034 [Duganella sp. CF517]|uniref:hypothetical protein n=1 Tax=Duganella sp. CF517 TaxID=1881038 RepID=UPI0008ABC0B5|nr:hypothetical protein [Duganella sp. CF517]SEO57181.1 hypothetical protein SAMN05428959_11034 [Duganella sp. CF517]